ncbi:dihydrodipicolinate synthase family protein [Rathayibacter tritici]|uniref:Dihydrodipicolinate synthase n=2 Tax=Rathayibacter tritici TaxID=33888 RepID=A0A160KSS9_9MICO|nr:dihydrodipicolinate synthase family protein [Rathayibacter tritici]AND16464.1 dihydrodipicolinate synthase [Rathayibacter tritici]PPF31752.1 dihydrodipicolinate synthase family protein [Rathayibacter tritici]PPI13045.1 dihydrodipicolinate synthase family protein [Rathayibacter tritici]PPI43013.1 dihydrodipicolinate synthase family protein [Rathayibacter tritici]
MLTGLSAFPLTPLTDDSVDEPSFAALVERLARAGVDSIGALGSTGSAPYLDRGERRRAAQIAVRSAGPVPVVVGIGALRTSQVLALAEDAQNAGASAVLLAPLSYQPLTDEEVFGLYEDVTAQLSVPLVVYDNPGTTHVTFTDDLYAAVAALPHVASIKIPGVPAEQEAATLRVQAIRHLLPKEVGIGVSRDDAAARGLLAGCDAWYSVLGGLFPQTALRMVRAVRAGDSAAVTAESARLQPLWDLFAEYGGSYRVVAAMAEQLGLVAVDCLPRPVRGLDLRARNRVAEVLAALGLTAE